MADKSNTIGILAKPVQPGAFRVCLECRSWFALIQVAKRDDELQGSITTYRCKQCGATFDFADRHPPEAV
jgi:hypothetical protein